MGFATEDFSHLVKSHLCQPLSLFLGVLGQPGLARGLVHGVQISGGEDVPDLAGQLVSLVRGGEHLFEQVVGCDNAQPEIREIMSGKITGFGLLAVQEDKLAVKDLTSSVPL